MKASQATLQTHGDRTSYWIGRALYQARLARGLSQEDLSRLSKVSRSNISYLERGLRPTCTLHSLEALALALDVSLAMLILTAEHLAAQARSRRL